MRQVRTPRPHGCTERLRGGSGGGEERQAACSGSCGFLAILWHASCKVYLCVELPLRRGIWRTPSVYSTARLHQVMHDFASIDAHPTLARSHRLRVPCTCKLLLRRLQHALPGPFSVPTTFTFACLGPAQQNGGATKGERCPTNCPRHTGHRAAAKSAKMGGSWKHRGGLIRLRGQQRGRGMRRLWRSRWQRAAAKHCRASSSVRPRRRWAAAGRWRKRGGGRSHCEGVRHYICDCPSGILRDSVINSHLGV